jgi:hypothetical protein
MEDIVTVTVQFFVEGDSDEEIEKEINKVVKDLESKFPYVDVDHQEAYDEEV